MTDDAFYVTIGRGVTVVALIFTFACAVLFVVRALQATRHLDDPVFTVAPDSSRVHPKPARP